MVETDIHLFGGPGVEIDGLHFADMSTHATMDARTTDTKVYAPTKIMS
jgi:hypothetical protein